VDQAVERVWAEISSEHDEVRRHVYSVKGEWVIHFTVTRSAHTSASFSLSRVRSR
jgi:hypothetical protein